LPRLYGGSRAGVSPGHPWIFVARIEHFIESLSRLAVYAGDNFWSPGATSIAPCSHMAAYQVLPVVHYYELTGHSEALAYAERLSRRVLYHDPTMNDDRVIGKTGWEGHLHAWMDRFSEIVAAGAQGMRSATDTWRPLPEAYEWVLATQTSPFGWVG
jgi:hypothetical protein